MRERIILLITVCFLGNIPTLIALGIYAAYRKRPDGREELETMNVQDWGKGSIQTLSRHRACAKIQSYACYFHRRERDDMSGHSKWHNIQKTKGAADAKRSQIFTKVARELIVAVKAGGSGDPANNARLATVIAKAKAVNMPNDNIKRTIDKALGAGNNDQYENVVYEGYGPNGVAVIVEALTDNRNRTAPEVRHLLDKYGKGLGATGCVSWSFDRKGVIIIEREDLDEDATMLDALEAGAEDFLPAETVFEVYTEPEAFGEVAGQLEGKGYVFLSAQVEMVPQTYVKLTDEKDIRNMEKLVELLEENDDVQNVWHNWEQE